MPINTAAYLCICTHIQNQLPAPLTTVPCKDTATRTGQLGLPAIYAPASSFFTQCQFLCQQMNVCCRGQPVSLTEATLICLQLLSLPSTRPPRPPVNSSLRLCEGRDFHLNPLLPSLAPGLSGRHCAGAEPLHPVRSAASGRRDASPAVGRRRALLLCCGPLARLRAAQASAHCGTASEAGCFLPPHPAPKYSTSS